MAFQEKIDQLVTRLTELTERGKISWEDTADEGTFLTSVGKFVVTLGEVPDYLRDEEGPFVRYRFKILDETGKTIDEASGTPGEDWNRLSHLHELARRSALHVDEALSDILSSLEHI
jgi:hypothetical protein